MANPERLAVRVIGPMQLCMTLFKPVIWLYSRTADMLLALSGLPVQRDERVTSDDILAMMEADRKSTRLNSSH